ncbi:hypothetical protein U1Q18_015360, partial [Sarracenia purpurea var. burkii]
SSQKVILLVRSSRWASHLGRSSSQLTIILIFRFDCGLNFLWIAVRLWYESQGVRQLPPNMGSSPVSIALSKSGSNLEKVLIIAAIKRTWILPRRQTSRSLLWSLRPRQAKRLVPMSSALRLFYYAVIPRWQSVDGSALGNADSPLRRWRSLAVTIGNGGAVADLVHFFSPSVSKRFSLSSMDLTPREPFDHDSSSHGAVVSPKDPKPTPPLNLVPRLVHQRNDVPALIRLYAWRNVLQYLLRK